MSDKKQFFIFDYISAGGLVYIGYVLLLNAIVGGWLMSMITG
ncbi:MAG: hypothetical protein AAFN77_04385 [Planctomycetota bacterium]